MAAVMAVMLVTLALFSFDWATRDANPRDFGSFWASGDAANRGLNPYAVYEETFRVDGTDRTAAPNLNPPASLLPLRLLAKVEIGEALQLWRHLSLLTYGLALVALLSAYPERRSVIVALWALNLGGLWHVIELGQVYVPLLALTVAAWLGLRDGRPLAAGLAMGVLAAIKPHLILWPAMLLLAGKRNSSLPAFATAAALSLLPLFLHGPSIYLQWLQATPSLSDAGEGMAHIGGNLSLIAIAGRFGVWEIGLALSGGLVLLCAAIARRPGVSVLDLSALAVIAALLVGPVTWAGYTILLLPLYFALRWTPLVAASAVMLCWPVWLLIEAKLDWGWHPILVESVYGAGVLMLLAVFLRRALAGPVLPEVRNAMAAGEPAIAVRRR